MIAAFHYAEKNNKNVHLVGLLSDGGVHSHIEHLEGLIDIAAAYKPKGVFLHAFTDGRDVDPKSGLKFIERIEKKPRKNWRKISVSNRALFRHGPGSKMGANQENL